MKPIPYDAKLDLVFLFCGKKGAIFQVFRNHEYGITAYFRQMHNQKPKLLYIVDGLEGEFDCLVDVNKAISDKLKQCVDLGVIKSRLH